MVTTKQKPTSRYTKYNEKGIKSYDYGKSSIHKGRQ